MDLIHFCIKCPTIINFIFFMFSLFSFHIEINYIKCYNIRTKIMMRVDLPVNQNGLLIEKATNHSVMKKMLKRVVKKNKVSPNLW